MPRLGADVAPNNLSYCNQTIFPIDGRGQAVSPGTIIEYEVEDFYGRRWAKIWVDYFEEGMQRPVDDSLFEFE